MSDIFDVPKNSSLFKNLDNFFNVENLEAIRIIKKSKNNYNILLHVKEPIQNLKVSIEMVNEL